MPRSQGLQVVLQSYRDDLPERINSEIKAAVTMFALASIRCN